ncbi:hypothetical protein IPL85_06020 [Candidatus Saccharibacteria bacterium]|nr:MAG: hypothetical protein IPL85_06020 [Candidatus Saccharibacteria bacterium]
MATKITEIYDGIQQLVSTDGRYLFEVVTVNNEATGGVILEAGTYSSSRTGNSGNVYETAVKAADASNLKHVVVALPGNGLSGALTAKERRYFAQHGSLYDWKEKAALPVVIALREVLEQNQLMPQHLTSDSAGAVLTTALGIIAPMNSIETVFQNVRTGWANMSPAKLAWGMLVAENKHAKRHQAETPDKLAVNAATLAIVAANRPKSYDQRGLKPGKSLPMLQSYLYGLAAGPDRGVDPLLNDVVALVKRQNTAKVLFVSGRNDVLTNTPDIDERIKSVLKFVSIAGGASVSAVMIEGGSHTTHTHYPQFVEALHRSLY